MPKRATYPKTMIQFMSALNKETATFISADDGRLSQSLAATMFGSSEPPPRKNSTPFMVFVQDAFRGYAEVFQAYDNLIRISDIARLRFKSRAKVTKLQFLTFVAEASLNEFYIFSERIETFLTVLTRKYKADPQFRAVAAFIPEMQRIISEAVQPLTRTRGAHVHERRFSSDDETLKRAGLFELLVVHGRMKEFKNLHRSARIAAERHLLKTLQQHISSAKAIATVVFNHLAKYLLDHNKRLRCPGNLRHAPFKSPSASAAPHSESLSQPNT